MASASQALYKDPSTAVEAATVPDEIFTGQGLFDQSKIEKYNSAQYDEDKQNVQNRRSGFLGAILNFGDKADDVANSVTGGAWDAVQDNVLVPAGKAAWWPVDKLATGAHWLYSEGVSQPLSTLFIQTAKIKQGQYSDLFSGSAWTDAYDKAEHLSPGQVVMNSNLTDISAGKIPGTNIDLPGGEFMKEQNKEVARNQERFIYDTNYWRDKAGWQYTLGSGATDFMAVMFADPSTYITGGVAGAVKGLRSIQYVERGGELVRDQGLAVNVAKKLAGKKPQTIEEVAGTDKMQKFFDWVTSPGAHGAERKTQAEIASHPIFGRGRKPALAKNSIAAVLANTARDDMPAMYRYLAGDERAAAELMAKGSNVVDNIGRIAENRKLVDSVNFQPELLAYFASKEGLKVPAGTALKNPNVAPTINPEVIALHQAAAKEVVAAAPKMKINAAGSVSKAFAKQANTWKAAHLDLIDQELAQAEGIGTMLRTALAENLGKGTDEFSTAVRGAHLFGSLPRAYRMGEGAFRSTERAAAGKFERRMADRKGVFSTETLRKGFFGTPIRLVQTFGDKTPVGRVNHNDADAGDRVYEMLREVPALGAQARTELLNKYLTAGDKTAKSRALDEIHSTVLNHMAQNVNGLTPEIASIFEGMVKVGVEATVNKLASKTVGSARFGTKQAFSSAMEEGAKKTVDHVEDGVGWAVSPLAKTQLNQTDSLLPIKEINRVLARNSGPLKTLHRMGAKPVDAVQVLANNFNTIWKGATLLRPAYTVRAVSEELAAAAIKFGFLSHIVAGGTEGSKNWVLNRGQSAGAYLGLTSYTPSTGKGVESALTRVKIGDEPELKAAIANRREALMKEIENAPDKVTKARLQGELEHTKLTRIKVNRALPIIDARIKMEREAKAKIESELSRFTSKRDKIIANNQGQRMSARSQRALDQHNAKLDQLSTKLDDHDEIIDEFSQYSNYVLRKAIASTGKRVGEKTFEYRGVAVPQAFSKEWANPISRGQFDAEGDVAASAIYARAEAVDTERMMASGSWDYITPEQPHHMAEWLNGLNHQFAQDEGFRLVMKDPTGAEALRYFATPTGKQHLKDIGSQGKDPAELVKRIGITLDKYLPESTGLRQKLLNGEDVTRADLQKAIAPQDFPIVHGQEILDKTQLWGKHQPGNIIDAAIKNGFKRLGSIPSSIMSRNPVYVKFQEGRMKELIDREMRVKQAKGEYGHFTPDELNNLLHQSDKLARKDMTTVVYDPQRTTASEALKFIAPFYSAHADGLARWGGLIAEKPQALGRLAQIYNAPVAANMVTDEQGNLVGLDGMAEVKDPETGKILERHFVPIENRVIQFKAPWSSKSEGTVPIKIQALNTVLPGDPWWNPGSGPIVQVTGSAIAKASPQAGDFLQWSKIMPYGPSGSMSEAITPKYMRSIWAAYKADDPDNEEYQKAYIAIWNKKQMEYHAGEVEYASAHPDATPEEIQAGVKEFRFSTKDIENEAKQFLYLKVLEAWGSPAQTKSTPLTGSPYQFYVDQLASMRKLDPENGTDKFLAEYGSAYAGFTASLTKSMGIAATISADQQAEKYKEQISADPDMASFWIGDVYNGGPFSSTVYAKQQDQHFGAAKARERIPAEQAIENVQVSTGWTEYKAAKNQLDSLLFRNGFKSYSEKGAEQLNAARQQLVAGISQAYPAWGEAFNVTDRGKIPSRINSFELALNDGKLAQDPMRRDIPKLKEYLAGRQFFKSQLESRGLKQVSYSPNGEPMGEAADIAYAWDQFKMGLVNSNLMFADLYNRYLTTDDLQG